ncbi:MAG: heme ABC transporter ATP-binding protein [Halodesulfurarchaeum sp.]
MIEVTDLSVTLGSVRALRDVDVSIAEGSFVGLIGPNGAGKTTLLRTIGGILSPDDGTVTVDGSDVHQLGSKEASRLVAAVPQQPTLTFDFSVREIVAMGRTPYQSRLGTGSERDQEAVAEALATTEVADLADRSITAVSGGERQRVLLARALAQDTPVLLLDEPTASLDIHHQVRTLETVADLVRQGKTVLAAIHDLNLAAHYCDSLLLLGDGAVVASGPPEDVLTEAHLERAFGTQAAVTRHPVTGSVFVRALPEPDREMDGPRVHVIGGGGNASRLLYLLASAGYDVSTGVLNKGDADLETARLLGIDAVTVEPFAPIDEGATADLKARIEEAAVTVVADIEVGAGNLANLEAAGEAEQVIVVEDRPFEERNYAGSHAMARYRELRERGTVTNTQNVLSVVEERVGEPVVSAPGS